MMIGVRMTRITLQFFSSHLVQSWVGRPWNPFWQPSGLKRTRPGHSNHDEEDDLKNDNGDVGAAAAVDGDGDEKDMDGL